MRQPSLPYKRSDKKTAKANNFNRLADGAADGGPHAMSQSLELIIMEERGGQLHSNSTEATAVESNIVVTSQLDQVTKQRTDDSGGPENWGVQAQAGTWGN